MLVSFNLSVRMEQKSIKSGPKTLKCIGQFILAAIFIGLSWSGLGTYLSQPISTAITITSGDNGHTIRYPQITICFENWVKESTLKDCTRNDLHFIALKECAENNLQFDTHEYRKSIDIHGKDYLSDVVIRDVSSHGYESWKLSDEYWSKVIHYKFGPCFRLDFQQISQLKKVRVE